MLSRLACRVRPLVTNTRGFASTTSTNQPEATAALVVGSLSASGEISKADLQTITAATQLGCPVDFACVGVDGGDGDSASAASKVDGLRSVFRIAHADTKLAEVVTPVLQYLVKERSYSHVFAPATASGKNVLPRLAGALSVGAISEIMKVNDPSTFVRPIYAGNALSTVRTDDPIVVATVRTTSFEPATTNNGQAEVGEIAVESNGELSKWISQQVSSSERPELSSASKVISGGRGMKSGENFKMLEEFADLMGGAVGASRAAVDAGMVPNELQVGQTGKIVAPDLYIAVGISGAIQHLAGMKDSKVIVAINKDPDAPIFQVADYGLVADLFDVVPEMTKALKAKAGK